MSRNDQSPRRAETDASLLAERENTDFELARRITVADDEADRVLQRARERADRLLEAARSAADARLPLSEQTKAAVQLLLEERATEDRTLASERALADELVESERAERREKLVALLVLERQTTDLHLALERRWADQAVSTRDEFMAHASHDLRGLMAAQKLYLSLLSKAVTAGALHRDAASHVATLVKIDAQMERLVGDLVDLVAIDAGKLTVTLGPHSPVELIGTVTAMFAPLAAEREQALTVAPVTSRARVRADAARTVQVLGNLLSNAIKFTPRGGKLRVGFEEASDGVVFFVPDSGPGVPPELQPRIFDRFVGSTDASNGLGLGLFIAARLVEAQGGRLWLDQAGPTGSVLRFVLPRS